MIVSTLVIVAILIILDYLVYLGTFLWEERQWLYMTDFLGVSITLFLLFINFLYNRAFSLKSKKLTIAFFIIFTLIVSMAVADRLVAVNKFYYYSKTLKKSTTGMVFQFDDSLSYKGRPFAKGTYNYYIGDTIDGSVPVLFDSLGFRTAPDSLQIKSDTTDLYLGCSFTFGDFVEAQKTYSYLTSEKLGHNYINAAISGFGSGQMIQIAETLLPKRKFHYVFIQLSSWIVPRAMEINGPTRFGYRPFPYFSDNNDTFTLNPPSYSTLMYSGKNWRKTERSYFEKIKFLFSDGYKIEIHDYCAFKFTSLKVILGFQPNPTMNRSKLESYFYNRMADICLKNSATPIFLKINYPDSECKQLVRQLRQRAPVIDIDSALEVVVLRTGMKYGKLYRIHHSTPRKAIQFDAHPNIFAHSIYTEAIVNQLKHK
jgi:hypothetical protein